MERESDKHGPMIDDEMKLETSPMEKGAAPEPRATENREKEPPANGEPTPDDRLQGDRGMTPETALSPDEVEARQELARHIPGAAFPGTKEEIISAAREMDAPAPVLRRLERLPEGSYDRFPDVWEALGGRMEGGRE